MQPGARQSAALVELLGLRRVNVRRQPGTVERVARLRCLRAFAGSDVFLRGQVPEPFGGGKVDALLRSGRHKAVTEPGIKAGQDAPGRGLGQRRQGRGGAGRRDVILQVMARDRRGDRASRAGGHVLGGDRRRGFHHITVGRRVSRFRFLLFGGGVVVTHVRGVKRLLLFLLLLLPSQGQISHKPLGHAARDIVQAVPAIASRHYLPPLPELDVLPRLFVNMPRPPPRSWPKP